MSNKSSFDFYCLWEELLNPNFKLAESRKFKIDSATQSFTMSPSKWIKETNAIEFVSKRGKYDGGTFAHPDIALEFTSWINSAFKLHLIKEFERLKQFSRQVPHDTSPYTEPYVQFSCIRLLIITFTSNQINLYRF